MAVIWIPLLLGLIAIALAIALLNRFFQKCAPETALIRTGAGGKKILIDGGCLVLPFLHQLQKVSLKSVPVQVNLTGTQSVITGDRLRADVEVEFLARIEATEAGLSRAAQALGSRAARSEEIPALVESQFVSAIHAVAATRELEVIHTDRIGFASAVRMQLGETLGQLGLMLDAVSLRRVDQTAFSHLDENNAFNAAGMRHLASLVTKHRKERAHIEAEAEMELRRNQLAVTQHRLETERSQIELEAQLRLARETVEADTAARAASQRSLSEAETAKARLASEATIKHSEIARDQELRRNEMEAILDLERKKIEHAMAIAAKRAEEIASQTKLEIARADAVGATEAVQTAREIAAAERGRALAKLKIAQENESEEARARVKNETLVAVATAEAAANSIRAESDKNRLLDEAETRRAMVLAENEASPALMSMKLEMHKLDRLPEIATQMMKPVEKIESIRINHIGGFGGNNGAGHDGSPLNQAMESILGMAVQLPMMKKLGEEIGLEFDANIAGRTADAASRIRSPAKPSGSTEKS